MQQFYIFIAHNFSTLNYTYSHFYQHIVLTIGYVVKILI